MCREHRAIDDAANEKIARDAAEGKLRGKRRPGGLNFDSDDSDEEDPDMKARRMQMGQKRRKIDRATLVALSA